MECDMRLLSTVFAISLLLAGNAHANGKEEYRFFTIQLMPTDVVGDADAAIAKRMPELPALATTYNFMPATAMLLVTADPAKMPAIEALVAAFNARPFVSLGYKISSAEKALVQSGTIMRDGNAVGSVDKQEIRLGNTLIGGWGVSANVQVQSDAIMTHAVVWYQKENGAKNSLEVTVPLKPGQPLEIPLNGPDRLTMTIAADVARFR